MMQRSRRGCACPVLKLGIFGDFAAVAFLPDGSEHLKFDCGLQPSVAGRHMFEKIVAEMLLC